MKLGINFVLLIILCINPLKTWAVDFYCDYTIGHNSNPGTRADPWKTPPGTVGDNGSGWAQIGDGDSLYLKGGQTYPIQLNVDSNYYNNGSAGSYVTIRSGHLASPAWGSGRAIVDGGSSRLRGIYIIGRKYVKIEGLQIGNQYGVGTGGNGPSAIETENSADHVWIIDNITQNVTCGDANGGYGIEINNSDDALVERNQCRGNAEKGIEIYHGANAIVGQNVVCENGEHGIVISGSDASVYRNIIYHNSVSQDGDGANVKAHDGPRMTLHNNVIYSGNGWNIQIMGNSPDCKIYNNTCYNGYYASGGDYYGTNIQVYGSETSGCEIKNNIFYYYARGNGGSYLQVVFRPTLPSTSNYEFKNNIVYGNTPGQDVILYGARDVQSNYFTVSEFDSAMPWASGNLQVDPSCEGGTGASVSELPTGFNSDWTTNKKGLQVNTTSPALAAGLWLAGFDVDIDGNQRPPAAPWTIGAYKSRLNPPSNLKIIGQ